MGRNAVESLEHKVQRGMKEREDRNALEDLEALQVVPWDLMKTWQQSISYSKGTFPNTRLRASTLET